MKLISVYCSGKYKKILYFYLGVYVTEGTIKVIWRSCPNLKVISLKDCGYVLTDNLMEQLLKVSKTQLYVEPGLDYPIGL
jgi:hypothetical protein